MLVLLKFFVTFPSLPIYFIRTIIRHSNVLLLESGKQNYVLDFIPERMQSHQTNVVKVLLGKHFVP